MQLMEPGQFFNIIVPEEIKKLTNIDINKPEYQETSCSIDTIERTNDVNSTYTGTIMVKRDSFPLYILSYVYKIEENSENCDLEIKETFHEFLEHFNIPCTAD